MAQQISHIAEGHSINHPLYFNGEDYPYWKDRMRLFIESTSFDMWEIIENGELRMETMSQLLSNPCLM